MNIIRYDTLGNDGSNYKGKKPQQSRINAYLIVGSKDLTEYKALVFSLEHCKCSINGYIEITILFRVECLFSLIWDGGSGSRYVFEVLILDLIIKSVSLT